MFLELIGAFVAGLGGAGLALLAARLSGGRLPRWVIPVAAGGCMIAYAIANEYSWYARTSAALPEGLVVAQTVEQRAFWQPWTYAAPYINRFVAVDRAATQTNPALPDQRLTTLYFFGRWSPVQSVPMLFDCEGARRADLAGGADFAADGAVENPSWIPLDRDNPVLETVCEAA